MTDRRTSPLRTLVATCHKAVGWVDFRLGRLDRARWHFERVLQLLGDDFSAYVHLGRVAYRLGDYAGWRRECGHAQRTAPARYARLRHTFDLVQARAAGTAADPADAWPSVAFRMSRVGTDGSEARLSQDAAADACPGGPVRRFGDDFSSEGERARFRRLQAISSADLARVDVDELARRLTD